jgi:hypothetical protein
VLRRFFEHNKDRLDAIHGATALKFKQLAGVTDVLFYTFDNRKKTLSESIKLKTNQKN